MNILTYLQAHPGTAVGLAGFLLIAGVLLYDNWGKVKLPTITAKSTVIDQRTAIDYSIALQQYFAYVNCPEGVAATEEALTHASHYHAPVAPVVATQPAPGSTFTVVGPVVTNSPPTA